MEKEQETEIERETTPTSGVGMNEVCFTLIIVVSSYVNMKLVH